MKHRLITATVAIALVVAFVVSLYQPWLAQWGSTTSERHEALPGDELVADGTQWTRSITIDGTPDQVWPWVIQMGVDKGGFYTYDWGEQLAGDPVHNATTIRPEWQGVRVGDEIKPLPTGSPWEVEALEPDRLLVLSGDGGRWSWTIDLRPLGPDRTRLVTRMRSHKASFLSYALDPADLIVVPRLLVGVKQRVEGTLPGLPGTHTGRPFPIARLPVHAWAALAWLAGIGLLALAAGPALGVGRWGRRRPHPGITIAVAFVAGAGYMLMSDTPPVQFFTHTWALGLVLAPIAGLAFRWALPVTECDHPRLPARLGRAAVAVAEAGLFIVLPATAVWQAATARGWTASVAGHVLVGAGAASAAVGIMALADRPTRSLGLGLEGIPAMLALGFAVTGSGIVPLFGAALIELLACSHRVARQETRRPSPSHRPRPRVAA